MNNEKIFIGGYILCNNEKCLGDCEGCVLINREWFEKKYSEITNFKNKEDFFFNYLNEDMERIINEAIKDNEELEFEIPECKCFKCKEKFRIYMKGSR